MKFRMKHGDLKAVENEWPRRLHTLDDYATAGIAYRPEPRPKREPVAWIVYGMGMLFFGSVCGAALTLFVGGMLR